MGAAIACLWVTSSVGGAVKRNGGLEGGSHSLGRAVM